MSLIVKTAPTFEALTLQEAKDHLRIDTPDEDTAILGYLKAARRNLESKYEIALTTQTLVLGLDEFPWAGGLRQRAYSVSYLSQWAPQVWLPAYLSRGVIELRSPATSIVSVKYYDAAGNLQTLPPTEYVLDGNSNPSRLVPGIGKVWPVTGMLPNAVLVEHVAGYTSPDKVPDDIRGAVRFLLGHYHLNREAVVTDTRVMSIEVARTVDDLMAPYAPPLMA